MEFLVFTENRLGPATDADTVRQFRDAERARADELRAAGHLKRLWRTPGRWGTVALWDAADATQLHDLIASLPLWRFTDVRVEALATHPQEVA